MTFRGDEALFDLVGQGKELGEHAVGGVEEVFRQVVAGVHEPGCQAATHAVDDRGSLRRGAALERQEIDIENVIHDPSVARRIPPGRATISW